jgi:hypothetical protein
LIFSRITLKFECYPTKKFLNSVHGFIPPIEIACKQLKNPLVHNLIYFWGLGWKKNGTICCGWVVSE